MQITYTVNKNSLTDKCIVLDIDETLVCTQENIESFKELGIMNPENIKLRKRVYYITLDDYKKKGDGMRYDFWGVKRPHVDEFLVFCFTYFRVVAIWSAGKYRYVHALVDYLFKDKNEPNVVFTRDDCEKSLIKGRKYHIKPLKKMYDQIPEMNMQNTYVLDDNEISFSNNPNNAVHIPKYDPNENIAAFLTEDQRLDQFKYWLMQNSVKNSKDVTKLNKSDIFNYPVDYWIKKNN